MKTARALHRVVLLAAVLAVVPAIYVDAHKPVTSKYTYTEHVLPIFQKRCTPCHVDGGIAPMSLLAYADARPWAESIRAELVAAHMPPGQVASEAGSLVNARALPPRDLDVVLTWATGGTPEGPRLPSQLLSEPAVEWPMGSPDVTIPFPFDVTLPRGTLEKTVDFSLASAALEGRAIRAVDLRPGLPAVVRAAVISMRGRTGVRPQTESLTAQNSKLGSDPGPTPDPAADEVIALWLPDRKITPRSGGAFEVAKGNELVARVTYRKTWRYENAELTDRSVLGVYFADAKATRQILAIPVHTTVTLDRNVQALAVRPDLDAPGTDVAVTAVLPDGSKSSLIRFTSDPHWPQRFWYEKPLALPRGTRLETSGPVVVDVVRN